MRAAVDGGPNIDRDGVLSRAARDGRATGNEAGTHSGTARWWQIVIEAVKRRVAVDGEKPGRRRFSPGKVEQR